MYPELFLQQMKNLLGDNYSAFNAELNNRTIEIQEALVQLKATQNQLIQREKLAELLGLPEYYQIVLVMALGKPIEQVVVEDVDETGNIKYYRDKQGVHHVPKRSLKELIWES